MNLSVEKQKLFEALWERERAHHRTGSLAPFRPPELASREVFHEYRR